MFDDFMISLPYVVPPLLCGSVLAWLVIRGAVLSALRKHSREQQLLGPDAER